MYIAIEMRIKSFTLLINWCIIYLLCLLVVLHLDFAFFIPMSYEQYAL